MAEQPNAFTLLRLPERFALEDEAVQSAWRSVIALVHPDRFAGKSAAERRVAEQWAGRINEAKDALLDPVARGAILLKKQGIDVHAETDTRMPTDFLLEQMRWREALEEAGNAASLAALAEEVEAARRDLLDELTEALDRTGDAAKARLALRRLMFVEKMRAQLKTAQGTRPAL
ncbi:MAG: Fe-S protein assembly co-chaperone HscB [Duodenibacillus sp.]